MNRKQKSKKWSLTRAQKRKRYHVYRTKGWYSSPPKWYCQTFHDERKNRQRKEIYDIVNGADPDDMTYIYEWRHRNIAKWYWW